MSSQNDANSSDLVMVAEMAAVAGFVGALAWGFGSSMYKLAYAASGKGCRMVRGGVSALIQKVSKTQPAQSD